MAPDLSSVVAAYLYKRGLAKSLAAFLTESHSKFSEEEEVLDLETVYDSYISAQTSGFSKKRKKKENVTSEPCEKRARANGEMSGGETGSIPFSVTGCDTNANEKHRTSDISSDDSAIAKVDDRFGIKADKVESSQLVPLVEKDTDLMYATRKKGHEALEEGKGVSSEKKQQHDTEVLPEKQKRHGKVSLFVDHSERHSKTKGRVDSVQEQEELKGKRPSQRNRKGKKNLGDDEENEHYSKTKWWVVDSQGKEDELNGTQLSEKKGKGKKNQADDAGNKQGIRTSEELNAIQKVFKENEISETQKSLNVKGERGVKTQEEQDCELEVKQASGKRKKGKKKQAEDGPVPHEERIATSNLLKMDGQFPKMMVLEDNTKQPDEGTNASQKLSKKEEQILSTKISKAKGKQVNISGELDFEIVKERECEVKGKQSSEKKKKEKKTRAETEENKQPKQPDEGANGAPMFRKINEEKKIERTETCVSMGHGSQLIELVGLPRQVVLSTEGSKLGLSSGVLSNARKPKRERDGESKSIKRDERTCEANDEVQAEVALQQEQGKQGKKILAEVIQEQQRKVDNGETQPVGQRKAVVVPVINATSEDNVGALKIKKENGKHTGVPKVTLEVAANPSVSPGNKDMLKNENGGSKNVSGYRNVHATNGSAEDPASDAGININGSAEDPASDAELNMNDKQSSQDKTLSGALAFRRVDPAKVKFADPRLEDNSYWAKDKHGNGWGAKAQEVLELVRGKDFRHAKTKKKRGSYKGGAIDLQSHSIKFNYSDDE